jgi:hypothetical protein
MDNYSQIEGEKHMVRTFEVRFTVKTPYGVEVTAQEAEDWIRFYMRANCSLDNANPLVDFEPEPMNVLIFHDY